MAELYDVQADPAESRNLIADPAYADTIRDMQARLDRALTAVGIAPEADAMPLDEGIGTELPEASIR